MSADFVGEQIRRSNLLGSAPLRAAIPGDLSAGNRTWQANETGLLAAVHDLEPHRGLALLTNYNESLQTRPSPAGMASPIPPVPVQNIPTLVAGQRISVGKYTVQVERHLSQGVSARQLSHVLDMLNET